MLSGQLLAIEWYVKKHAGFFFYINCTINPILYNVMSKRFRRAFRDKLCSPQANGCLPCSCEARNDSSDKTPQLRNYPVNGSGFGRLYSAKRKQPESSPLQANDRFHCQLELQLELELQLRVLPPEGHSLFAAELDGEPVRSIGTRSLPDSAWPLCCTNPGEDHFSPPRFLMHYIIAVLIN